MRGWVVREITTPLPRARVFLLIPVMALILGTGAVVLLLETGYVAAAGYNIQHLEKLRADCENRLLQLEAEVATLRSLDRVEREARTKLKMVTPKDYVYMNLGDKSEEVPAQGDGKSPQRGRIQSLWQDKISPIIRGLR